MVQLAYESEICLYAWLAPIIPRRWIGANDEIKIICGVSVHRIILGQSKISICMYILVKEHVTTCI